MPGEDQHPSLLARFLPATERASFAFDLVCYQIQELNALGDRLTYLAEHDGTERELADVTARCDRIIEALRWNAEEVVELTWTWLLSPLAYAEDAFGPALVLTRFCSEQRRVDAWFETLSDPSKEVLRRLIPTKY